MKLTDHYIRTFTGKKFYPFDPKPEQIDIRDIAAGLSKMCRYTGQIPYFYSVAEHSMHVASILPEHLKLSGLLHDASEAYLSDIAKPIKMGLVDYQSLEWIVQDAIGKRYGVEIFPEVKDADFKMLLAEFNFFMPAYFSSDFPGLKSDPYLEVEIQCFDPEVVEQDFLGEFEFLSTK